ncbi:glycosyltransferase family 2 protein [Candidatus Omnitrophota bacterium]
MTNNNSITVSVNTFNRPDSLSMCFDALTKQAYKDFDVIVVNGGEDNPVNEIVRKFDLNIKIVKQKRKGLVEARNLCWKETNKDIVCIIDDDLIVSPNWVKEVKDTFLLSGNIGGVTGPTIIRKDEYSNRDAISFISKFENGSVFWRTIGKFYLNFIMDGRIREIGKILDSGMFTLGSNLEACLSNADLLDVDYLEACCMCLRRRLIEEAGGFDYCYSGTSEWSEPDLTFKVKKLGYRLVFNPKAAAEHRVSQQGVFKARTYAYERSLNFINFYFRHIKPNSLRKFIKFYSYLLFMNCYWLYKAIESRNINWLTGIFGTVVGETKNTLFRCRKKD